MNDRSPLIEPGAMKNNPNLTGDVNVPEQWISRRNSSPDAVRRVHSRRKGSRDSDAVIQMIDHMQPGDELRAFRSPRKSFKHRAGRRGYVVLRNGRPVYAALTGMN